MKKNLGKTIVCLIGVIALSGFNMTDAKAEEEAGFKYFLEEDNNSTAFSARSNMTLQHSYYVINRLDNEKLIENYQTTYWFYGPSGVGLYQSPKNTIRRIASNANFLNGEPKDDHISGTYVYTGDVYYNNLLANKVSFTTTMNADGTHHYSENPEVFPLV